MSPTKHPFAWSGVIAFICLGGALVLGLLLGWADGTIGLAMMLSAVPYVVITAEIDRRSDRAG
jgi:hypothetical protein